MPNLPECILEVRGHPKCAEYVASKARNLLEIEMIVMLLDSVSHAYSATNEVSSAMGSKEKQGPQALVYSSDFPLPIVFWGSLF